MHTEIKKAVSDLTVSVQIADQALGIGGGAVSAAARRGDFPTVKVGRAVRVPKVPLRRMLGLDHEKAA